MIHSDRLKDVIRDSIAQKRVIKWGYVREFGGAYPADCDSVGAHTSAVASLATILAYEISEELESETTYKIDIEKVMLTAIFHDFGEGRSGDTGASSFGIRNHCDLYALEREGLSNSLDGLRVRENALSTFDHYRAYNSVESLLVHVADIIEGTEKGLHQSHGRGPILDTVKKIVVENVKIFRTRIDDGGQLSAAANFLLSQVLIPALLVLSNIYDVQLDLQIDSTAPKLVRTPTVD